jgi:hypothetical protein
MNRVLKLMCAVFATTIVVAGCTDYESSTDLNPEGPPMVQQMRFREAYKTASGGITDRRVFGFGTHPDALEAMAHPVTSARVRGNGFRVIMDELLVGNNLEEVGCRANVDGDPYSRVPLGSTPDDVARCATAQDVLPSTCKGDHAMCLCELDAGCPVTVPGSPPTMVTVPRGSPVGIDDRNQDGAADDTRLIRDSVGLRCGTINVPIDLDMSYWNPSGNQQVPAMGGFDALGPAIVLVPTAPTTQGMPWGLPTNLDCQLVFAPDVVDKQNIQVCAPPNGDILSDCTPGDTSKVSFKTEPLYFETSVANGATGVPKAEALVVGANTRLDLTSTGGITITAGAVPFTTFTVTFNPMGEALIITPMAPGFAPNTTYTLTVTSGVKDTFGQPAPAPLVVTFTTGA